MPKRAECRGVICIGLLRPVFILATSNVLQLSEERSVAFDLSGALSSRGLVPLELNQRGRHTAAERIVGLAFCNKSRACLAAPITSGHLVRSPIAAESA